MREHPNPPESNAPPTMSDDAMGLLSLQQVSDGFQKLATAAELTDPLREFRVAAREAERAEHRRRIDTRERRRQRHHRKTAVIAFLRKPEAT